jgi:hypothetical protein
MPRGRVGCECPSNKRRGALPGVKRAMAIHWRTPTLAAAPRPVRWRLRAPPWGEQKQATRISDAAELPDVAAGRTDVPAMADPCDDAMRRHEMRRKRLAAPCVERPACAGKTPHRERPYRSRVNMRYEGWAETIAFEKRRASLRRANAMRPRGPTVAGAGSPPTRRDSLAGEMRTIVVQAPPCG